MKKFLFLLITIIYSNLVFSQGLKLADYSSSYFNETFKITAYSGLENDNSFNINIYCHSFNSKYPETGIHLDNKSLNKFTKWLKDCKKQYVEWSKTAKENNVKDFSKTLKEGMTCTVFYYDNQTFRTDNPFIMPKFQVLKDGRCLCVFISTLLSAGTMNALAFSSAEEFDNLINSLDKDKALELIKSNESSFKTKDKLFK